MTEKELLILIKRGASEIDLGEGTLTLSDTVTVKRSLSIRGHGPRTTIVGPRGKDAFRVTGTLRIEGVTFR